MTKKTQRAKARAERKPRLGEELIRPDGSVIRYVREEDDDKKVADHFRTVDTLALMLRNRTITEAMHDAVVRASVGDTSVSAAACLRAAEELHRLLHQYAVGVSRAPSDSVLAELL